MRKPILVGMGILGTLFVGLPLIICWLVWSIVVSLVKAMVIIGYFVSMIAVSLVKAIVDKSATQKHVPVQLPNPNAKPPDVKFMSNYLANPKTNELELPGVPYGAKPRRCKATPFPTSERSQEVHGPVASVPTIRELVLQSFTNKTVVRYQPAVRYRPAVKQDIQSFFEVHSTSIPSVSDEAGQAHFGIVDIPGTGLLIVMAALVNDEAVIYVPGTALPRILSAERAERDAILQQQETIFQELRSSILAYVASPGALQHPVMFE